MAYRFPERYLAYYLATDRLGLVTSRNTNSKNNYEQFNCNNECSIFSSSNT